MEGLFYRNKDIIGDLATFSHLQNKVVFVFFDPWTIRHHKLKKIVQRIMKYGFEILAFNFHLLKESDIEQIYRKNPPITMKTSWHLPREVYEIGQSCGILFYLDDPNTTATELMKNLKGKSNPVLNGPGKLRYDFRAPNKSLSLMHSSDDWDSTLNESTVFFSQNHLKKVFSKVSTRQFLINKRSMINGTYYDGMEYIKEQSATNLLLKIRLRILNLIDVESYTQLRVADLKRMWGYYLKRDFLQLTVEQEVKEYLAIINYEESLLKDLVSQINSLQHIVTYPRLYQYNTIRLSSLADSLMILNNVKYYSYIDGSKITDTIPVFFDQWEKLLFKTTLFHFEELLVSANL
jgi:nucleoside diphosphate kinase